MRAPGREKSAKWQIRSLIGSTALPSTDLPEVLADHSIRVGIIARDNAHRAASVNFACVHCVCFKYWCLLHHDAGSRYRDFQLF